MGQRVCVRSRAEEQKEPSTYTEGPAAWRQGSVQKEYSLLFHAGMRCTTGGGSPFLRGPPHGTAAVGYPLAVRCRHVPGYLINAKKLADLCGAE